MNLLSKATLQRLAACLFGGFFLALMVGPQEGTLTDFGVSFREAVSPPRIFVFLAIGVAIFFLITFWPLVVPYLERPGVAPLGTGLIVVIAALTVMNWYDPLVGATGSGKFSDVSTAASATPALSAVTPAFFSWLAWTLLVVAVLGCGAAVITRLRAVGYGAAVVALVGAVLSFYAHTDVVNVGGGIDHSLGMYTAILGFGILAGAGVTAVHSRTDVADTRGFIREVQAYRPGLLLMIVGIVFGALAFTTDGWFAPLLRNLTFSESQSAFAGTGISSLASLYLSWLGLTLFIVCIVLGLAAVWLRERRLAMVVAVLSAVSVVLTFLTLHSMTNVAADAVPQFGTSWKNLGAGGFVACMVFAVFSAAMTLVLVTAPKTAKAKAKAEAKAAAKAESEKSGDADKSTRKLPVSAMVANTRTSPSAKAFLIVGVAVALFYPPTLPVVWQNVLVGQIGVFVLLAIGLNVVVGWAGLLDLGYIAFYEIGSYVSAYLVGALPVKPPSWLTLSPLATIPFAILACLIAGVLLGAPTLRLRGDYLAIVTLGFGEIIQILAVNNPGGFTGGPQGPTVPHPRLHLLGFNITWGQDNLSYWYLLLIMLVIVIALFYRLEGSRLGRAWASIREDEVAAQATGVNTTRAKLLAFAIGASTSALAGSFFATQVGYFDPTLFTLQASILIVAYVVFGGMGSLPGAIAGAAVLTWLPQFLKDQVPQDDRQMWVGALVLAMMIFRPAGLIPAKRRKAELTGLDAAATSEVRAVPAGEGI